MKTWADLTDEMREGVLDTLAGRASGLREDEHFDEEEAYEAARAVLLAACSPALRIVPNSTTHETGTYSDPGLDAARRARDEARAVCELALRAAAASLVCSTCQGLHGVALVEDAIRLVTWPAPKGAVEPLQAAAQTRWADLRRERDEALAREARLRAAAGTYLGWAETVCSVPHPVGCSERLRAALALPADGTALDALLAEARHEGARAAWRSPSAVTVLENVERAAAEVGAATKEKP